MVKFCTGPEDEGRGHSCDWLRSEQLEFSCLVDVGVTASPPAPGLPQVRLTVK